MSSYLDQGDVEDRKLWTADGKYKGVKAYTSFDRPLSREDFYTKFMRLFNTIVACGALVYGGAVRDKMLHDMHAAAYYPKKCKCGASPHQVKRSVVNPRVNDGWVDDDKTRHHHTCACGNKYEDNYSDITHHPDTLGRLVIPSDIDIIVAPDMFEKVERQLRKSYAVETKYYTMDCADHSFPLYLRDNNIGRVAKMKVWGEGNNRRVTDLCTTVDVIIVHSDYFCRHSEKAHNTMLAKMMPLFQLDCACNALLYDSEKKYHLMGGDKRPSSITLESVKNEVRHCVARALPDAHDYRLDKMRSKGWTVVPFENTSVDYATAVVQACDPKLVAAAPVPAVYDVAW